LKQNGEARSAMSVSLTFSAEMEQRTQEQAIKNGETVEAFIHKLVEREVLGLNGDLQTSPVMQSSTMLDEILAPFRQEVRESGMTDDELRDFFTEVRDEVRTRTPNHRIRRRDRLWGSSGN
jgi:hypothetical protein